jgi:hypothetical protein
MRGWCRRRALGLLALPLIGACGEPWEPGDPPADSSSAAGPATVWHALGTWSGRGERQTESFDVTSGSLRLTWETLAAGAPGAGRFTVTLHSAISGRPLETIVETQGPGADTASLAAEPRVAYLLIKSEGLDWRVRLEEGVRGGGS